MTKDKLFDISVLSWEMRVLVTLESALKVILESLSEQGVL